MSFVNKRFPSSVKLPATLAIGFTGHRHLPEEAKLQEAIRRVLLDWKARVPDGIYGVSSVAAGGDLLFAETCLELGLPLRIFLPLPKEQFRDDFDEAAWRRAECVLAKALSVEITGASETRTERYYECGIETIQQSQLLIALWDGGQGHGMGGTADMVHFAKQLGRPIVWIHSATGAVQELNQAPELLHDPELDFLNSLPDSAVKSTSNSAYGLAQTWFAKIDENASRVAPQFRRLAAIPIFCTAAAALFSGRGTFSSNSSWLWIGTVLGVMAGALPVAMKLEKRQTVWTRVRTAAEVCRSCLALWHTPALYDVVGPEIVPELSGMLASLNFLKLTDREARQTTLENFKRLYRENRIQNQIAYFSRHANHSSASVRQYRAVVWATVFFGASLNVWIVLSARGLSGFSLGKWKPELALAATIFFQIATVAGALLVVNDHERRRERYRELHRMLTQWDKQLELSQTWPIVLRITSMAEKALLAELLEWRSHIRHRKVPQK